MHFLQAVNALQAGDPRRASVAFRALLDRQPRHADAWHLLGVCSQVQGLFAEAVPCIEKAIALNGGAPHYHYNLGRSHLRLQEWQKALTAFTKARALDPRPAEYWVGMAQALDGLERNAEARLLYEQAVASHPQDGITLNIFGLSLKRQGLLAEAAARFQMATQVVPSSAESWNNLGNTWRQMGLLDQAEEALRRAVTLLPNSPHTQGNWGHLLMDRHRFREAARAFQAASRLQPAEAIWWLQMGKAWYGAGQTVLALEAFGRCQPTTQEGLEAASYRLMLLNYMDVDAKELAMAHAEWGLTVSRSEQTNPPPLARATATPPLRVGYLSADFRNHSVGGFLLPVLAAHDPQRVLVHCYSNWSHPDDMTRQFQQHAAFWREIAPLSDQQAAELIRGDQLDLLVDLAGHTVGNRLAVFAQRPAPVQITWLGYPHGTGLPAMDARLTDGWSDPLGMSEGLHTEKLFRLPDAFFTFAPPAQSPQPTASPWAQSGRIRFGSLQNINKLTAEMLEGWRSILESVPHSELLLQSPSLDEEENRAWMLRHLQERGLPTERIRLHPSCCFQDHLALYNQIDLVLDTYPWNGHTSTLHALWMGVPVLTRVGMRPAARMGWSILGNLGLEKELAAQSLEEYVQRAIALAKDPDRLATLRREMRERLLASPLVDHPRFTHHLEQAFLKIMASSSQSLAV
ncbi:MAG: tetratricopeptide repeat protein [Magnetococcus sp. YQC-3]